MASVDGGLGTGHAAQEPDPVARVRALYTWFGAGKGGWSGCPSYEGAAEQLLLAYPVEVLLAALDASTWPLRTAQRDCSARSARKIACAARNHCGGGC